MSSAGGNKLAFKQLYELTSPKIFAMLLRLCGQRDLAEDLLQESFVTIWRKADQFNAELGSALAWMRVVARNKALDRLRATNRAPQTVEYDQEFLEAAEAPVAVTDKVSMQRCLKALPENHRKAVVLTYLYGLTNTELAKRLAIPLGTAKSWVRRGLESLRSCMEK